MDVYTGGPNLFTAIVKTAYTNSNSQQNIDIGGLPTIGLRAGYMVSDRISLGVDINYTTTNVSYDESNGSTTYNYKVSVPRIRAMARFEFHFGNSDNFDFYMPVGAGYSSRTFKIETNDPAFIDNTSIKSLVPVAFRVGLGGRYFFTDNIGLNLEFGLGGGPLIEGGLAFKF